MDSAHVLSLNHYPGVDMEVAPGFALPKGFHVQPFGELSGRGEDDPIHATRLERDGWRVVTKGAFKSSDPRFFFAIDPPRVHEKPTRSGGPTLRVSLHGIHERDGSWYVETSQLVSSSGQVIADLDRTDWADLDHNGDVLFASSGCLYRLRTPKGRTKECPPPTLVADLNDMRFEPLAPSATARSWPKSARQGNF